jgi:hypothetical protein
MACEVRYALEAGIRAGVQHVGFVPEAEIGNLRAMECLACEESANS